MQTLFCSYAKITLEDLSVLVSHTVLHIFCVFLNSFGIYFLSMCT